MSPKKKSEDHLGGGEVKIKGKEIKIRKVKFLKKNYKEGRSMRPSTGDLPEDREEREERDDQELGMRVKVKESKELEMKVRGSQNLELVMKVKEKEGKEVRAKVKR